MNERQDDALGRAPVGRGNVVGSGPDAAAARSLPADGTSGGGALSGRAASAGQEPLERDPAASGTAPNRMRLASGAGDRAGEPEAPASRGLPPDPEEVERIRRASDGDVDAFRELVETHQSRVLALITRMLHCRREAAEDLCQEVFLRSWRALPRFDGAVRYMTWIHRITVNACISEIRRRKALKRDAPTISLDAAGTRMGEDRPTLDPVEPRADADPSERAHQADFAAAVRLAVAELPEEFRSAVLLRDLQGLSYEEISTILDVPVGTVRSRIHRGRLQLQAVLEDYAP